MNWFAKINGQVYGPYSDQHMHGFVAEGRITAHSQISNAPVTGFFDAISFDIFSYWSGSGQIVQNGNAYAGQSYQQASAPLQPIAAQAHPISDPSHLYAIGDANAGIDHNAIDISSAPVASPAANTQPSIFVIMAEIRSSDGANFMDALHGFGPTERIGDNVWLLRTVSSPDILRNALSQALSRQDRMFILDSFSSKTAWFNIGADLDHRIRALWDTESR